MEPAQERSANSVVRLGVVIADGHPIVLRGLEHVFASEADLDVLACCTTDDDVLTAVSHHQPDVVVLDPHIPRRGAFAVLRELAALGLSPYVVLLAPAMNERQMSEALRLGVRGVVLKELPPQQLLHCIRRVGSGETWIENGSFPGAVERLVQRGARMRLLARRLTPRELEIVNLVGSGMHNKDITTRLDITEGTVKVHLHNIYEKLGIRTRVQLALCARDGEFV